MPELPEVETTRRGISPHIEGKRVRSVTVRQTQLRWPIADDLAQQLHNRKLQAIQRRGKYLLFKFTHGWLLIHLGMSGSLRITQTDSPPKKHDHVDISFSAGLCLRFHDPRRFGAILWSQEPPEQHRLIAHLGPEPLSASFTEDHLFTASRKRNKTVKALIMDSRIVVGVGNIYANEALFAAGIRPTRPAARLTRKNCARLTYEIRRILQGAITQGGTTLRDFVGGDGKPGYFAQRLKVYGRAGKSCEVCGNTLKEIRQAQRTSVYCCHCQC
ncbi:MAG: bifunctional DNA-formamidopyrimidine glycosylase/DNA-(apurinic or apyrimidinic site) lyase [Cellvibrionaceae bacterium]|nr:bifunctional DNA-formamidopyrimidine glycosylase/DNA-(apurinic or apyrimidinic site) lyase [Cellvibrionaceae bacterium]